MTDQGPSGLRVLIVEDNDIAAQVVQTHVLSGWGDALVTRVETIDSGMDQVRTARWDVVLLDLGLPGCDGLAALRRLREVDRTAPIVVLTANEDEAMAVEALDEDAQDYLSKREVDAPTLSRAIRYAMGRQQNVLRMREVVVEARAQERNLHELIRRSADGVLVFDAAAVLTFVNAAAVPMFGKEAGDLLGGSLPVIDLSREQTEIEVDLPEGTRFLDVRVVQVDWQGAPCRMALVRDQTERRRGEALKEHLQRSERLAAVGRLAAGIAHEINNPLTYVMGSLDLMAREFKRLEDEGVSVERLRGLRDGALEGTSRVVSIVRDLSVFSRRDAEEKARPTDLQQSIESALKMVHPQVQHRARVVREYGDIDLVVGQSGRLTQVFVNLVVNAAHAIEEGHVEDNAIVVRTWQDAAGVHASVRDSGGGIEAEALGKLFEPFFTTKGAGEGTGLGLYVCRNIIESYGGSIDVASELGVSTCFDLVLPTWREALSAPPPPMAPLKPAQVASRILIVDDEERIRDLLKEMLAGEHEVVVAGSGAEAQTLLESDRNFDVVLCDVVMDDGSGVELQDWMESHAAELLPKLLFMTGGGIGERSSRVPIDERERVLTKPFRREDLLRRIDPLLRGS